VEGRKKIRREGREKGEEGKREGCIRVLMGDVRPFLSNFKATKPGGCCVSFSGCSLSYLGY